MSVGSFFSFSCVSVCGVCMFIHACMPAHMCKCVKCMQKPEADLGNPLQSSALFFCGRVFLLAPDLADTATLARVLLQGSTSQGGLTGGSPFTWALGFCTPVSCLHNYHINLCAVPQPLTPEFRLPVCALSTRLHWASS